MVFFMVNALTFYYDMIIIAQYSLVFYGNIGYFRNYIDLFQSSWYTVHRKEAVVCIVS